MVNTVGPASSLFLVGFVSYAIAKFRLVDIEDGDVAEITVSNALVKYYKRNLTAYCNELKAFCTRHGAAYVLASTDDSVEKLVLNYLRRIQLLR